MELNPRALRIFCAVADTASLAAAASRVGRSPSAVSRIISELELDLKAALFDRSQRRLQLTPAGRDFHARARDALLLLDELAAFGRRQSQAEQLRVAALSRHAETVVAPALAAWIGADGQARQVMLDVHSQRDFGFTRLARPFDLGFGHLAAPQEEFALELIALSPLVVVSPPGHCFARMRSVPLEALAGERRIDLKSDTVIGAVVAGAVGGQLPPPLAAVSHTYIALRMVAEGLGVHLTDRLAALSAARDGCAVTMLDTDASVPFAAFWPRRNGPPTPLMQALIARVRGLAAQ
jgi:DNA-binding transcriptional LysR family regulator